MSDSEPPVRRRKPVSSEASSSEESDSPRKPKAPRRSNYDEEDDPWAPYVDALRVLTFLFVASCGLSYLVTSGESWFWSMKNPPSYLRKSWWQTKINGPSLFTLEELAQYDGTDESKPIYLSINGTVYDVSANRRTYGPGGSYHVFAGVDASRGFVTGCFQEDRTGDMRGVYEMYLPLDDPEVDKHWTSAELEKKRSEERAHAKKRAYSALKHWTDFFAKSDKYHEVGKLKREPGWEGPRKKLCDVAQNGRTPRKVPEKKDG